MRFLIPDNSNSGNEENSSRTEPGGTPFSSVPSVMLNRVRNMWRSRTQQRVAVFGAADPVSEHDDTERRTEHHNFTQSASAPTRRFEFDNINVEGPGLLQESGEQGVNREQISVPCVTDMQHLNSAADPARRRRRRSLDGERQIVPDSTTSDVSVTDTT
jgi:hypothetical protein